jgi:stage V sporulation protein G
MATKKKVPTTDKINESNKPHYEMVVTAVQVFPFRDGMNLGHMKGLAQVVLNDALVLRGLRICDGENGMFVQYPIDPFYKGDEFRSIVFPMTRALREHIENSVLEKYEAEKD